MIAQIPGFSTTTFDELTISQALFEEYISDKAEQAAPSNPLTSLYGATTRILRCAFWLANQKALLAKSEFKKLLNLLEWKGEEKKYIKVAQAFADFEPHELAQVEPRTIFQLAENPKKYATVFSALAQLPQITQDAVRNLIKQCRTPRKPKQEEEPSIWRRTADGGRVCQVPPIYNEATGVALQAMMESEGDTATGIVSHAIAILSDYIEGKLIFKLDLDDRPCDDVFQEDIAPQSITLDRDAQFDDESELDDITSAIEFEVETSVLEPQTELDEVTSTAAPKIDEVEPLQVQDIPRWQLGWNVGDMVVAHPKSQHFHSWCDGQQVEIKTVSGKVGTIQFIEVVRADGETYDTFGDWIEDAPIRQLQVGDKVIWTNCYAHLWSWQPFLITGIHGDKAKLDIYQHLVPLDELELYVPD
jgi:hypothetical protein